MKDSVAYIQIYLMSYVFLMLYQVATGIFSAFGGFQNAVLLPRRVLDYEYFCGYPLRP